MNGARSQHDNNSVIARLKPGVSAAQADADARALVRSNALELYPASLNGLANALIASAVPLADEVIGRSKTLLWVALAAVGFVLLIACADIASLMLTRAMAREREIAVRAALGAGRGRLVRLLLAESAVLALVGSALGLLLAVWLSRALVTLAPPTLPRLHEITIDGRVLAFTALVSAVTAILCGVLPAIELSRPNASDALKDGGRTTTAGRRQRRIFGTLASAQVAVAVVLLVGGGLLFRSFNRLMSVIRVSVPITSSPFRSARPRGPTRTRRACAASTRASSTRCHACPAFTPPGRPPSSRSASASAAPSRSMVSPTRRESFHTRWRKSG